MGWYGGSSGGPVLQIERYAERLQGEAGSQKRFVTLSVLVILVTISGITLCKYKTLMAPPRSPSRPATTALALNVFRTSVPPPKR